jgi:hypothetical protein
MFMLRCNFMAGYRVVHHPGAWPGVGQGAVVEYGVGPIGAAVGSAAGLAARRCARTAGSRVRPTAVSSAAAEPGFQQATELKHAKGIDDLGVLPAELQNYTVWAAPIRSSGMDPM